jgi:hypothetical protein
MLAAEIFVIPAQAGIQIQLVSLISLEINQMNNLGSRLRGNDGGFFRQCETPAPHVRGRRAGYQQAQRWMKRMRKHR